MDYFSDEPSIIHQNQTMKQEVSIWIGSEDFLSVCELSGISEKSALKVFINIKKVINS